MTNILFDTFLKRFQLFDEEYNRSFARVILRERLERIYAQDEATYKRDFVGIPRVNMRGKLGVNLGEQNPIGRLKHIREIANDKLYLSSYPQVNFERYKGDLLTFLYLYIPDENAEEEKAHSYLDEVTRYFNDRFIKWRGGN